MKSTCLKYVLFLLQVIFCIVLNAQDVLSGKVVTEKGNPLAGASVFIPNTSIGTINDKNGEFILNRLPRGNFKLVASFINYTSVVKNVPRGLRSLKQIIRLKPKTEELNEVVVRQYDKDGWNKWGALFISAFIGTSSYAKNCNIINRDDVKFIKQASSNILKAYALKPLIIENTALGYSLSVELSDFRSDLSRNEVDYQVYTFFTELKGSKNDVKRWKKNRRKVYEYSLMRFMRSLYDSSYKDKGYEVRLLERTFNAEKQRVQQLYAAAGNNGKQLSDEKAETLLPKDSLAYYRKILKQDDWFYRLHNEILSPAQFITRTDSGTIILNFNGSLQVINSKLKEPDEYYNYRTSVPNENEANKLYAKANVARESPATELTLTEQIPIEVNDNGFFTNIDLFMNGFWGWWEKMGVKLPYEYDPDE